jgi:diadenosine tetraphosphatase ApaH/serine/threonine PP2A family protein phosphatase
VRLAIITDIHSNLPALEAVLEACEAADVEQIWCLGDVVGYGAQPDECAEAVRERCELSLVGNHDLAVLGELEVSAFSPAAAAAVEWTRSNSASETLDYLRGLEPSDESREVGLYHASPRDPVWEYVLWMDQAAECIELQPERVCLIGHSHIALYFVAPDEGNGEESVRGSHAEGGTTVELSTGRWLVNPGSVGQPRDGDPRAAWLELDTDAWTASYHRVEYDIDRAAEAITEAKLPEQLARRLYVGQ